jgi:hypothetical protein
VRRTSVAVEILDTFLKISKHLNIKKNKYQKYIDLKNEAESTLVFETLKIKCWFCLVFVCVLSPGPGPGGGLRVPGTGVYIFVSFTVPVFNGA